MRQAADKELAKRVVNGDRQAFDVFFATYYPRLYRFALVRLDRDVDLADETAQSALCLALDHLHEYRGEAPLFTWLCTICRHELARQKKARDRAQGDRPLTEDDPVVRCALDSLLAATAADPDVQMYQGEIGRLVLVAMDALPALYADVLEAKYIKDLPVARIARLVGRSPKATESILTRARAAFRDAFETLLQDRQLADGGTLGSLLELEP